ncbi:CGNR zinc finger domain-containing protein [Sorangium sp. So ce1151]|uniref:CGNR zinc finger domain-containing protein n=1 Tax=Sorangium sp. So ce1151 TaxID=3133332 RepID=UPI003F60AD86
MVTSASPFLWLGNHRALDFLNTEQVQRGARVDLLPDLRSLVAWCEEAGILDGATAGCVLERWEGSPAAESALEEARQLRSALRALVIDRPRAQKAPAESAIGVINRALRLDAGYTEVVRARDGFARRVHVQIDAPDQLLRPIAEAAASLLCDVDPELVKRCGNPDCVLYFHDVSRNHARRWCSMELCGNRMKVAAHYLRNRNG